MLLPNPEGQTSGSRSALGCGPLCTAGAGRWSGCGEPGEAAPASERAEPGRRALCHSGSPVPPADNTPPAGNEKTFKGTISIFRDWVKKNEFGTKRKYIDD